MVMRGFGGIICMFHLPFRLGVLCGRGCDGGDANIHRRWVDGFNVNEQRKEDGSAEEGEEGEEKLLYTLHVGAKGFEGCHRAHLLDALVKIIPEGTVEFGKRIDAVEEVVGGKVRMRFVDGSSAEADARELNPFFSLLMNG